MEILVYNIIATLLEYFIAIAVLKPKQFALNTFCVFIFIQYFILHAFLDPFVMADLPGYIRTLKQISNHSIDYSINTGYAGVKLEFGWIILCKLLSEISCDYRILLIVTSLIMVGSYCFMIRKFSPMIWLSLFIYLCVFFNQSLFVLRQHTAMGICLISTIFLVKRNYWIFFAMVFIAFSLHYTAAIFILLFFMIRFKYTNVMLIKLLFVSIVLGILSPILFNWFFVHTWYGSYADKVGSNYTGFFISACNVILYLWSVKGTVPEGFNMEKCFFAMALIGLIISFVGVGFSPTNRLVKYFTISSIFLIPISITKLEEPIVKMSVSSIVVFFYTLLFFSESNIRCIENYTLSLPL